MRESQNCPSCDGQGRLAAYGLVAPWICELVGAGWPTATTLLDCPDCELSFFSKRYEDDDLARLYSDYRTIQYAQIRRRWEPWYRDSVNNAYEPGSSATSARVAFLEHALRTACVDRDWTLMVDVGGDAGQFFPTYSTGRRIIIDPSSKPLPTGIERVAQIEDLDDRPDLMILAHVLEHLTDPLEILSQIHAALGDDGRLYVEVPTDRPQVKALHRSTRFDRNIHRVARHRSAFVAADFVSGSVRQFGVPGVPAPMVKQSEHINYFNRRSLHEMLSRAGFAVDYCVEDPKAKPAGLRLGLLGAVARKR